MSAIGICLFAAAWIGHTALLIYSLNWWYGNAVRRGILTKVRRLHAVVGVAGGILFAWVFGIDLAGLRGLTNAWQGILAGYMALCWLVAFGYLPFVTIRRLVRRPHALVENHTQTVDVARALGHPPIGRGKHRHLARLPGNGLFRVDFAVKTLRLKGLPMAWEGLSILHLSDFHMCGTPDKAFFRYVIERCADWEPDLVAITGDTVDSRYHHRWILPVLGKLRWKVAAFAILGNHESWYDARLIRRRLKRVGFQTLANTWVQIVIRGEPLVVIGNESPWFRPAPDLSDCPKGRFRLCLSHTPDNIGWARQHGVDLMLAGHNHGGQVRFPVIGSVLVPSRYSRWYDAGTYDEGETVLHVCRGLSGQHPIRYNCHPEVAKLVLKRGG